MDTVKIGDSNNGSNNLPTELEQEVTGFTSCGTNLDIKGRKLTVRMLRMNSATMVIISPQGKESLDEMGVAFPSLGNCGLSSSTTIFGSEYASNSQRLAELWSKRHKRQFIVCCNVQTNDIDGSLVERSLSDWICANVQA
ncbi:uncharacterized protein LOC101462782 isoform X2 [Ceratitis capitata]|uniref:(Mediterranean fruit fly) hypothetical protein n=2 Tax=Ceratitis capitata TaxID=7213 RepID=W8C1W5_CERCA|nr:uncharacterized protein LOC101462782 isoform X2 [Ceratitis capitata]CAD7015167.1 unnamed protein product [Ceratitis capitata]